MSERATATLDRAGDFIWRNARLLERRLFACLFQGGPSELVVAALAAYENPDGGFGSALEPDIRCPGSQPQGAEFALRILDGIGFDEALALRACDYLESVTTEEGGVPFSLPSVRGYPHAPWWDAPDDPPASLNPTAAIVGLLRKQGVRHRWIDEATRFCWRKIDGEMPTDAHGLLCVLTFLESAEDRARADATLRTVAERLLEGGLVAFDPNAPGYVFGPLDWAPTPTSPCRPLFADEVIAAHLKALAARQQPDGGWPITWPAVSPACELEWRGIRTIGALKVLRAYGWL